MLAHWRDVQNPCFLDSLASLSTLQSPKIAVGWRVMRETNACSPDLAGPAFHALHRMKLLQKCCFAGHQGPAWLVFLCIVRQSGPCKVIQRAEQVMPALSRVQLMLSQVICWGSAWCKHVPCLDALLSPVKTKKERLPMKPAKNELKGNDPTSSMYTNCTSSDYQCYGSSRAA